MKRRLLILTIFVLMIFAVACQQATQGVESSITGEDNIKRVKVTADQINVKRGCANDSQTLQTSDKNSTFDVVNKVADWYAVKLPDNSIGFVPQNQCKPIVVEDEKPQTQPGDAGAPAGAPTGAPGQKPTTNTNNNSSTLTSQEQEMLRLVNEARSKNGVAALQIDMELTNVARIKSQDMIDNNYFSHNSPKYGSPFDMMKKFGISYVKAGENIAGNRTVSAAHESLMNSPGHRKNILSPDYTHIGIGIKSGGQYGNMFTQMFISKPK